MKQDEKYSYDPIPDDEDHGLWTGQNGPGVSLVDWITDDEDCWSVEEMKQINEMIKKMGCDVYKLLGLKKL